MSTLDVLAASITTISAYQVEALVITCSKHLTRSFNIPEENDGIYASKLNASRFLFKFLGFLIELILYIAAQTVIKRSYKKVLDSLSSEIKNKRKDIEDLLKGNQKRKPISITIEEESTINEILKAIKDNCNKTRLQSLASSIKNGYGSDTRYLKTYEKSAVDTMVKALQNASRDLRILFDSYEQLTERTFRENGLACAGRMIGLREIGNAAKEGECVLFDFETIFAEILIGSSAGLAKILIKGRPERLKNTPEQKNINNEVENDIVKILRQQITFNIRNYQDGIKRKAKIIELAAEISNQIVDDCYLISMDIQKDTHRILGGIDGTSIEHIKKAIVNNDNAILNVISQKTNDEDFGKRGNKLRQNAEEISKSILNIKEIKLAVTTHSPSYTLFVTILEYILKRNADIIGDNLGNEKQTSQTITLIESDIKSKPMDLVITLVKSIVTEIITAKSTEIVKIDEEKTQTTKSRLIYSQIRKGKEEQKIENNIKETISNEIYEQKYKKKIKVIIEEINLRDELLKNAENMAKSTVDKIEISQLMAQSSSIFGRELSEQNKKINDILINTLQRSITQHANAISNYDNDDTIKTLIIEQITNDIHGELIARKDEILMMKAEFATRQFRGLVCIFALAAMLSTRIAMLCYIHKSPISGYHPYILMIIESLCLGTFQTAFLATTEEQSRNIRISIELSNMIVFTTQCILSKLFYKTERTRIIVQVSVICVVNFLAIIMWIYKWFDNSNRTENKDDTKKSGNERVGILWSPYLMFFFASSLRDFMYPNIVPNALVTYEKFLRNGILLSSFSMGGILIGVAIYSIEGDSRNWLKSGVSWAFLGPLLVVSVMSTSAIHSRLSVANYILENNGFVLFLLFNIQFCYSVMATISYIGVSSYVLNRKHIRGYIESHSILCDTFTFFISKLSGGYDKVRADYGLGVNVPEPDTMEQPTAPVFVRECLSSAWTDMIKLFTTNISDCL